MTWIRVASGVFTDPQVLQLADALGLDPVDGIVTHLVALWLQVAEHSPEEGRIGDVADAALEQWARWPGPRGRFAEHYRRLFQTKRGCVNEWRKYNGQYFEDMRRNREAAAERKRRQRAKERGDTPPKRPTGRHGGRHAGRPAPVPRDGSVVSTVHDSTTKHPPKSSPREPARGKRSAVAGATDASRPRPDETPASAHAVAAVLTSPEMTRVLGLDRPVVEPLPTGTSGAAPKPRTGAEWAARMEAARLAKSRPVAVDPAESLESTGEELTP